MKLKDIDNTTNGCPPNGYSDFTSNFVTELTQGSTYSITVDLNYTNSPNMGIGVWIDLNNNGSFDDPGEQLLLANPPQNTQLSGATITIPANIGNTVTRMRIRATYDGAIVLPCGANNYWGEVEDYTVVIGTPTYKSVAGSVSGPICYNANQRIYVAGNGTTFTVQNGGSATMIAGHSILYLPGTTVQYGGYMLGYIAPNGPFCVTPSMPAVVEQEQESLPVALEKSFFKVYPNPTTGNFILELTGEALVDRVKVDVYGSWGEKVLTAQLSGERKHEFSLSDRPEGVYFIRVITGDKAKTVKIIKQ